MSYETQSFVVIGGGNIGGIGFELVKELFSIGVEKVAVFDITDPSKAIAELKTSFPNKTIKFHKVDVRNRSEIEIAFKAIIDSFGYVDVLVNCAGIVDENRPKDVIEINLLGVIYGTLIGIDHMSICKGGHGGTIINIASLAGLRKAHIFPIYCASKHGVVGFTRSFADNKFAAELGIKFILICPGFTDTTLLSNMESTLYGNTAKEMPKIIEIIGTQTASECAKNIVETMKISVNGSTWILNNGKYEAVKL